MKKLIMLCLTVSLSSCSSTEDISDDVVQIGKDTYQLSATIDVSLGFGNLNTPTYSAGIYCKNQNKAMLVKSVSERSRGGIVSSTTVFMCLSPDDPRYIEASPDSKADITIKST